MDLYVANIDNSKKKTWRTMYEEIDECYYVEVKIFPRAFINICKIIQMIHKTLQLISRII